LYSQYLTRRRYGGRPGAQHPQCVLLPQLNPSFSSSLILLAPGTTNKNISAVPVPHSCSSTRSSKEERRRASQPQGTSKKRARAALRFDICQQGRKEAHPSLSTSSSSWLLSPLSWPPWRLPLPQEELGCGCRGALGASPQKWSCCAVCGCPRALSGSPALRAVRLTWGAAGMYIPLGKWPTAAHPG